MRAKLLVVALLALGASALAQTSQPKPKAEIDQSTPQKALSTYLAACNALDFNSIKTTITGGEANKLSNIAHPIIIYHMWQLRVERQAIEKFGEENGITVFGHLRSLDKQFAIDQKRMRDALLDYKNDQRTRAVVFMKREKDRPENLQVDKFRFRDDFTLVKSGDKWFVDYFATYELNNPEKESETLWLGTVHNKMAAELKKISEQLKAGVFKSADDVKLAVEAAEKAAYDEGTPKEAPAEK